MMDATEKMLADLGVDVYCKLDDDAYRRTVTLLDRTEARLSNALVENEHLYKVIDSMSRIIDSDRNLINLYSGKFDLVDYRTFVINDLACLIGDDAKKHELYSPYDNITDKKALMKMLAARVGMELTEAMQAADEGIDRFKEEMADVIIMTLSACHYLGIHYIGEAIEEKRLKNIGRPVKHGKVDDEL